MSAKRILVLTAVLFTVLLMYIGVDTFSSHVEEIQEAQKVVQEVKRKEQLKEVLALHDFINYDSVGMKQIMGQTEFDSLVKRVEYLEQQLDSVNFWSKLQ